MSVLSTHAQLAFLPAASEAKADWMVKEVSPMTEDMYTNEPTTPTFLWTIPVDGDRKTILVFELYRDRDALYNIHFKGQPYADIKKILGIPGLLDGKINLVNASPIAGFLTRSDDDSHDYHSDYTRCAKLSVKAGKMENILSTLKERVSSISSVPVIRSFLAFQPFDEVDTIYIWERYASLAAFSEVEKGSVYSKVMDEIKRFVDGEEVTGYRVAGGYLSR